MPACVLSHSRWIQDEQEGGPPCLLQAQWRTLLAGAAAGILSRTATAPLETLRVQAMTAPVASASAHHRVPAAGRQLQASAKAGLAASHPATLLRAGVPAGGLVSRPSAASVVLTAPQAAQQAQQLLLRPVQRPLRLMSRLWQAAVLIVGRDGWKGLYRGNGVNTLRAGPQKAFDWFFFEAYRVRNGDINRNHLCTASAACWHCWPLATIGLWPTFCLLHRAKCMQRAQQGSICISPMAA